MKKIILLCAGGMSTSILARKMKKAGDAMHYEVDVRAHMIEDACKVGKDADVVFIGPQIRYLCNKVKEKMPNKIVEVIDMKDYGAMDGEKVLRRAKELIETH
ncbi:MAG: PTS sugar transporter subunit IIB [Erysipelotrichaceae bacterium]|nr:PTS sugar transporter subunit IIB [Erysipelotrichaceae bacterium]MDY5251575.1 PTS sugar transporter subunit IIB [Erysipelotrichaceae bacterium]